MPTFPEIESSALQLPEDQRAKLATHLLDSLPNGLSDDDLGISEALRRDAELDRDPTAGMTMNEFKMAFES